MMLFKQKTYRVFHSGGLISLKKQIFLKLLTLFAVRSVPTRVKLVQSGPTTLIQVQKNSAIC